VAGGLDDRGIYGDLFESDQVQYSPGFTAVIAKGHSREAIAEALYNRSCYATTGERIIVGLYMAGIPMGRETSTIEKPGLAINRHLSGYVAGTTFLKKVEIIRNGQVIKTFQSDKYSLEFEYDDMTPIEKVTISSPDKKPPFIYYYLRVTQSDDHMAWSSPIWVDCFPKSPVKIEKRPVKIPIKKIEVEDFNLDDEDFEDDEEDFDEDEE
jgi:hypothetical protein